MNRCANCLSENIVSSVNKDRIFYVCKNCGMKNAEILDSTRPLFTLRKDGLVCHKTVAALVNMDGKYLFLNRRQFPFGFALPTGHVNDNETPDKAIERELYEETGLKLKNKKLILNETVYDRCKNGGDIHEWFLYEYKCKSSAFIYNEESSQAILVPKEKLEELDIVTSTKYVLSRIGLLSKVNPPLRPLKKDNFLSRKNGYEKIIIESLPVAILVYGKSDAINYINKAAKELLNNFKKEKPDNYKKFMAMIRQISIKCQKSESDLSSNINLDKDTYNVVANPIFTDGKIAGSSLVINNVSDIAQQEAINVLSYQTSLAVSSPASINQIVKTLLKQLFLSLDIVGCSLMTLDNGRLKIAYRYSNVDHTKRKPLTFKIGEGVAGWVAEHKLPLAIPDTSNEPLYVGPSNKKEKSILSVPVISNDINFGVLNLSRKQDHYFSEQEIKMAQIVANRIGLALENNRLYDEIKFEKEQLNNIIENTGEGIAVIDSKGKPVVWNNAAKNITGFETAEAYAAANPSFRDRLKSMLTPANKSNRLIYKKVQVKNYDNQTQWLGVTYSFIINENHKLDYIIIMLRDISKETEIESQQREFIYTATHELRTPITAIKGYLSMILNGDAGGINKVQRLYFDRAARSTDKLVSLVEDLLKVARLEENRVVFESKPFSAAKLIGEICSDFKQKAADKKIKLCENFDEVKDIRFIGDYEKTKQALANIVDNAIKYTKKGEVKLKMESLEDGGRVISVSDTGVGIPKKDQNTVFNKFIRIPNPESIKAGGTGLGLFIVKNLIEKQGGSVKLESILNKGTKISLHLPEAK